MFRHALSSISALALVVGLASCSAYPQETVEGYFTALSDVKPEQQLEATKYSAPGSLAEAYALEQSAHTQARLDGGNLDTAGGELFFERDEVHLCPPGTDAPRDERELFCSVYSEFEVQEGRLVNFHAGESSLEGRLAIGDGEVSLIGELGTAEYLASYVTISGDLVVILEITSQIDTLTIPSYDATYLSSSGRGIEVSYTDGPFELKRDRVANVAFAFSGGELGGVLELEFYDEDFNEISVAIQTK